MGKTVAHMPFVAHIKCKLRFPISLPLWQNHTTINASVANNLQLGIENGKLAIDVEQLLSTIFTSFYSINHTEKTCIHCVRMCIGFTILYNVHNIRWWPLAGDKCMPHTLFLRSNMRSNAVWEYSCLQFIKLQSPISFYVCTIEAE